MKKAIVLGCAIAMLLSPIAAKAEQPEAPVSNSFAEVGDIEIIPYEEAQKYFENKNIISPRSTFLETAIYLQKEDGAISIMFITTTKAIASEIGMKDLSLFIKDGLFWKVITTQNPIIKNSDVNMGGLRYLAPESGKKYKASGDHYAKIDGKEHRFNTTTANLTY